MMHTKPLHSPFGFAENRAGFWLPKLPSVTWSLENSPAPRVRIYRVFRELRELIGRKRQIPELASPVCRPFPSHFRQSIDGDVYFELIAKKTGLVVEKAFFSFCFQGQTKKLVQQQEPSCEARTAHLPQPFVTAKPQQVCWAAEKLWSSVIRPPQFFRRTLRPLGDTCEDACHSRFAISDFTTAFWVLQIFDRCDGLG